MFRSFVKTYPQPAARYVSWTRSTRLGASRECVKKSTTLRLSKTYLSKYSHEPGIGYLGSVGPLLFSHIFISIERIVLGLSGNSECRWIHQSLETCISDNWMKWGQKIIKHENMKLKFCVVIKSFRTFKSCASGNFWKIERLNKTTKTLHSTLMLLAPYLQKKQINSHLF